MFFWSYECPHCQESIPGMKKLAQQFSENAKVIAISVDSDEEAWEKAVSDNALDWINISDLKGWDGKIVNDYYIYATPTILVLDKNLKILAKPTGVKELKDFMEGTVQPGR